MLEPLKQYFRTVCYYCFLFIFLAGLWTLNLFGLFASMVLSGASARSLLRKLVYTLLRQYINVLIKSGCLRTNHEVLVHINKGKRGAVVIANHPSILDAPIFLNQIPDLVCVFKSALKQSLLLPKTAATLGYLSNDQGLDLLRGMADTLKRGETVLIFPEGTRTEGDRLPRLNQGYALAAIHAQVPIHLVYIDSDSPILSKRQHFLRACKFPVTFNFEFGPTIEPGDFQTVKQVNRFVESWYNARMNDAVPAPRAFLPIKCISEKEEASITVSFTVPESPFYCLGHMPGKPLVPGYVQMAWVRELLNKYEPRRIVKVHYTRWKFIQPILPDDAITLVISGKDALLQIALHKGDLKVTQGRITLEFDSNAI
jgi:1-acyl-sn-glycerol-3-phosphate acyltransferase